MKIAFFLSVSLLFTGLARGQNILVETYDQIFPNNKRIQIQRLNNSLDSLQSAYNGLNREYNSAIDSLQYSNERIALLQKKLEDSKAKMNASQTELETEISQLTDSIRKLNYCEVNCSETNLTQNGLKDPIIRNSCQWRQFCLLEEGIPDKNGIYSWKSEIKDTRTKDSLLIINSDLFKTEKMAELEKIINAQLSEDLKFIRKSAPECFPRRKVFGSFKINDMRITFTSDSRIFFEANYGLSTACYGVNYLSTGFKIYELQDYFK